MSPLAAIQSYINDRSISIAPLITFRIFFGALMAYGGMRFMLNGWIEKLYLEPTFFFKFYGFEWVQPLGEMGMYAVFALIVLSALGIMLGCFYRLSAIVFFLCFTYVELIDASNYLNHYYLVCCLSFWLIFLPANRAYSVDTLLNPSLKSSQIPAWCIHILMVQLAIVYGCAGIAKLNPDWLFRAMPLSVWLPEHAHWPIIGYFFQFQETAYLFSWIGAFYDLTIVFFLLNRHTRLLAYLAVVVFHLLTAMLFNIGLFPFIMIFSALIFFPAEFHQKILGEFKSLKAPPTYQYSTKVKKLLYPAFALLLVLQLVLPFRHHLYDGNILWTEEGYKFSWRVMLVEKNGQTTFHIQDPKSNKKTTIINGQYLTHFQEKQMNIQPDFIYQFAQHLKQEYQKKHGIENPIITVDSYVALNGRVSQQFIDPTINLANLEEELGDKKWILDFKPSL